jgi:hypothetical protein
VHKVPEEHCVDCGAASPKLEEEQTLRSTLGWRLTFEKKPDGSVEPEWRCPTCWQRKKRASQP